MPYQKNKRQAFENAQQAYSQLQDAFHQMDPYSPEFGHQVKLAEEEINEANQIINKAYTVASEHQKEQLELFSREIAQRKQEIMD
ncbi:hypothetical protein [Salipaludibacillus daqingensis]|uniref:hypothetical protein n=1 Tax=Salipaludibacillus daqingensis TaxID=3041001 RepID=UPI0024745822|nr:hypothetical protein [Salipaludibacillus daqingensis]